MKKLRIYFAALAFAFPLLVGAQIQEFVIGSLGGEITASNGVSFLHSIGDVGGGFAFGNTPQFTAGFPQCFNCDNCATVKVVEIISELSLRIFPNPTEGWLSVEGATEQIGSYQVFNAQGALLMDNPFTGQHINLHSLPGGIYIVRFSTRKGEWAATAKVLKH